MTKARDLANSADVFDTVSATELGYLDGVTSAIQTQLDSKAIPANVVNNTLVDAKGDLITATAADTPARLAVGNNGETLVADSSASTGLRWQGNFAAGKNKIINGDFRIWQRGTSFTNPADNTYTADRFRQNGNGSGATKIFSRQQFTPGTAPVAGYEGEFFYRYAQTVAGTGATYTNPIQNVIEDARTFAGQTVTWSFWAKADAARVIQPYVEMYYGSGGSGYDYITSISNVTLTTTWTRYTFTFNVPSVAGKTIGTGSYFCPYLTVANNTVQTIDFWGWQLEAGNTATDFQTATGTLAGELAACQRYYWQPDQYTTSAAYVRTTTTGYCSINMLVPMRVAPSATYIAGDLRISSTSADFVGSSVSGLLASKESVLIQLTTGGGMTAGAGAIFFPITNSAIKLSAEL